MYDNVIDKWRLRGRPFDPRERALSRGEQRALWADRIVYGAGGVFGGALMLLYIVAMVQWWPW